MARYFSGGMVLLLGIWIVFLTLFPTQYVETTLSLNTNQAQTVAKRIADQVVRLRLPKDLPAGEPVLIEMTLLPAKDAKEKNGTPVILQGRLDLPEVETFPAPLSEVNYEPEQTISFRWLVTAGNVQPLPGRLWLTEIAPTSAAGENRTVLLAYPLELQLRRVVGLQVPEARWVGGGIAGLGLAILVLRRQRWSTDRKIRTKIIPTL